MDSSNSSVDAALDEAKEDSQRTTTTDSSLGQTDSSHEDLHPLPSRKASSTASPASSSASSTMTTRGGGLPSGRPPTRSATVSSATPSKPEDIRTDTHHASPLQRAHTTGIPRPSMSRPWLSGSYDSKSASTLLDSEAAALLSTKGSGSVLTFASQKRDAEFHELFPLLEKSEFLVEDYSCAWQKEVLVQGRLYLTTKGMHFYAKLLLKWVYQVSIPYEDILSMDKKYDSVSGVFNNSILVSTDSEKYFFASFVNRDETFTQTQSLLDNKSAHKTIPMTSILPRRKGSFDGLEKKSGREAWGEGIANGESILNSKSTSSLGGEANAKQSGQSGSRDGQKGTRQEAHKRSQSEDLDIRHSQGSQLFTESRRRASLNALYRPKSEFENSNSSGTVEKDRTRESSLKRADTMVAKTDLISSHTPDLGLIEIAREGGATSTDGTSSFRTASPGLSPSKNHIVHQTKHIIHHTPSRAESPKSFESNVSGETGTPSVTTAAPANETTENKFDDEEDEISEEPAPQPKRSDHPHPVNCTCHKEHTEMKLMLDHTFNTSVETLWEILFGSKLQESDFCIRFWGQDLKYRDIRMTHWKTGTEELEEEPCLSHVEKSLPLEDVTQGHHRRLSYTVPSSNPLGPREIKTLVSNQVLFKDTQNHFICVMQTTRTPLVPAGDCFDVKIKTCISHRGPNKTQLKVSCRVNFVKSSWIRIAIERAVPDTLRDYYGKLRDSLEVFIREEAKKEVVATFVPGTVSSTLKRKPKMPARGGTPVFHPGKNGKEDKGHSDFASHPLESELEALKREEESARALMEKRELAETSNSSQSQNTALGQVDGGYFASYVRLWHRHQPWLLPTLVTVLLLLAHVNTLILNAMVRTLAEIHRGGQPTRHTDL